MQGAFILRRLATMKLSKEQLAAAVTAAFSSSGLTMKPPPAPKPAKQQARIGATENAIAARWATRAPLRPRSKLWYIHRHHCAACGTSSEFTGQPLVRYENETTGFARELPTLVVDDLPVEVIDLPELEVDQCPACLRLGRKLDDLLALPSATINGQRSLFS